MKDLFATAALLVGAVYAAIPFVWLAIHPLAGFWQRRRGPVMPLLALLWLALAVMAVVLLWPSRLARLYDNPLSLLAWGLLLVSGFGLYRKVGHFGAARLLGQAEVRPQDHEQRLVTTGLHSRMRHPIYLAHALMLIAWTAGAGTLAMFVLCAVAFLSGILMIRLEDAELEQRFGEEFRKYRSSTPAIIPKPRRYH